MAKFKAGDRVVHLGMPYGGYLSRGMELIILEGPLQIEGWAGRRYIVDRPVYSTASYKDHPDVYHANEDFLLKLI